MPAAKKNHSPPERFKIKVSGLPRFYALADPLLQDFLRCIRHELKLNCIYARFVRKGNAWLYLTFPSAEEQQRALQALKRYTWKGRTLVSMLVTSDMLKRKTDCAEEDDESMSCSSSLDSKKQKVDVSIAEQVLMSTIPYHSLPYTEQLKQKNEEAHSLVSRLHDILVKRDPHLAYWCARRIAYINRPIPFVLDKIRPSPVVDGYRNKYEFSVGINPDTETVAVGIRIQDKRDGIHHVGPSDGLRHLPKSMITLVKSFEQFVLAQGDEWDLWYHLIIRTNRAGEIMVTVSTNPHKKDSVGVERMRQLKDAVVDCFKNTSENVVSIYFQIHGDKPISDTIGIPSKSELLWGREHIKEQLLNLQLEITPVTYFRINSAAAEVLCNAVAELANVDEDTTLLDLFCGSGSLALTLAPYCKEVIAVELIESNIMDARKYAVINNVQNCEFIAGKIEDMIHAIIGRLRRKKVVVILDPPRTGIDAGLVKTLRHFKEASRFIYVCSNHKLPLRNLLDFSSLSGSFCDPDPVIPVRIIPIDMTPHTLRSELVILCERFDLRALLKEYEVGSRQHQQQLPFFSNNERQQFQLRTELNQVNNNRATVRTPQDITSIFPTSALLLPPPPPPPSSPPSALNNGSRPAPSRSSFPPRSNCAGQTTLSPPPSYNHLYLSNNNVAEDRYSSFRRDFENAIDSSYPTTNASATSTAPDYLPIEVVRKIEETAFKEGLTRGIQQSAFQVGFQTGLRTSVEKLHSLETLLKDVLKSDAGLSGSSSNISTNGINLVPPPASDNNVKAPSYDYRANSGHSGCWDAVSASLTSNSNSVSQSVPPSAYSNTFNQAWNYPPELNAAAACFGNSNHNDDCSDISARSCVSGEDTLFNGNANSLFGANRLSSSGTSGGFSSMTADSVGESKYFGPSRASPLSFDYNSVGAAVVSGGNELLDSCNSSSAKGMSESMVTNSLFWD